MPKRIAPLVLAAAVVVIAGCARPGRRVAVAPSRVAPVVTAAQEIEHPDGPSCECGRVQCYDRSRAGCHAWCADHEEPQCDCDARCTVMGRLIAYNRCACKDESAER